MNSSKTWDDPNFEGYRRDRKRRHLESGPKRDLGRNPSVLRELELAEAEEMRDAQMSREVNDFFSDATRTAAEIVSRVAEAEQQAHAGSVSGDMAEFLHGTISRAQSLIEFLRQQASMSNVASTEVEPMLRNIVGQQLDEFRHQGTADLADKHIGQDPFATELEDHAGVPENDGPVVIDVPEMGMEDHLAAAAAIEEDPPPRAPEPQPAAQQPVIEQPVVEQPVIEQAVMESPAVPSHAPAEETDHVYTWMAGLRDDTQRLTDTLRLLVANSLMSKDEAVAVYRELK